MSSKFGLNVDDAILVRLFVCSWVSVLLFLLLMCCRLLKTASHTYVDPKYVSTFLANLVKSGYFSHMSSCIQKSTEPASFSCDRKIGHLCNLLFPGPLWISSERLVDQIDYYCNALKLWESLLELICDLTNEVGITLQCCWIKVFPFRDEVLQGLEMMVTARKNMYPPWTHPISWWMLSRTATALWLACPCLAVSDWERHVLHHVDQKCQVCHLVIRAKDLQVAHCRWKSKLTHEMTYLFIPPTGSTNNHLSVHSLLNCRFSASTFRCLLRSAMVAYKEHLVSFHIESVTSVAI